MDLTHLNVGEYTAYHFWLGCEWHDGNDHRDHFRPVPKYICCTNLDVLPEDVLCDGIGVGYVVTIFGSDLLPLGTWSVIDLSLLGNQKRMSNWFIVEILGEQSAGVSSREDVGSVAAKETLKFSTIWNCRKC